MTDASISGSMSPELLKVVEVAKRDHEARIYAVSHLIDEECLKKAFERLDGRAAVGKDGVSKEDYGKNLQENVRGLHQRLKAQKYVHQPILRVMLPKEKAGERPIGISALEDKIVQCALSSILGAIYEQDFLECSYGFRPGRGAHDAVRALTAAVHKGEVNSILEADIKSFFDSVKRDKLEEMLRMRVADKSFLRLIGKCLNVGVLEGEEMIRPDDGTPQGSIISPILGNIYLHHVLDVWFEKEIKPRLEGKAILVRYADDFIMGFEKHADAVRVMAVLGKRMEKFGLTLHPDKTRLVPFGKPPKEQDRGKGPGSFDFLGFTFYWERSRWGQWTVRCKTRQARLSRAITRLYQWCRRNRHLSVRDQHAGLKRRIQGHYNYFGVNGNLRSLKALFWHAGRAWFKWLSRRSQRSRLTWQRFNDLLKDMPLPFPRIMVQIWRL